MSSILNILNKETGQYDSILAIKGDRGADGISPTHSWNGTVLTVTSASGTSSVDLKGDQGEQGAQGEKGENAPLDTTLTVEGNAADAKAVGDALAGKANTEMVNNALAEKQDTISVNGIVVGDGSGNFSAATVDSSPTSDSANLVTSGGVKAALDAITPVPFIAGTSAPSNTSLFWIDTTASTGGLKYYNGSAWVAVPVSYT